MVKQKRHTAEEIIAKLRSGDMLVCCADGVTEARDQLDEEYGEERLIRLLQSLRGGNSSAEVIDAVHRSVFDFTAGAKQSDDMTTLVLRVR